MSKCQVCKVDEAVYAYQPFGPDPEPHKWMACLGSHYRGFPVIKVCEFCENTIEEGTPTEFIYKGVRYISSRDEVYQVPDYVSDALLWLESKPIIRPNE